MKYFIDTEFNGFGGALISLALVPLNRRYPDLYIAVEGFQNEPLQTWVRDNVAPIVETEGAVPQYIAREDIPHAIGDYLRIGPVNIVSDWPDDLKYFMESIITGPGEMIETWPTIQFALWRVDAYPTTLKGAIQHNALWDARALREKYVNGRW